MKTAQEVLESKLPKNRDVFPYCEVLEAMQEFATLHAQKTADKMVSERLREMSDSDIEAWAPYKGYSSGEYLHKRLGYIQALLDLKQGKINLKSRDSKTHETKII